MLFRIGVAVMLLIYGLCFHGGVAAAQTDSTASKPPLWAPQTFSVGVGAGVEALIPEGSSGAGAPSVIAYVARPMADFALVARASWLVEKSGDVRVSPGIHYRFPVFGEHFAAGLSYDVHLGGDVSRPKDEWATGLVWARQLGRTLVLGASASYGLDTHDFRPVVQLTLPLHTGRN